MTSCGVGATEATRVSNGHAFDRPAWPLLGCWASTSPGPACAGSATTMRVPPCVDATPLTRTGAPSALVPAPSRYSARSAAVSAAPIERRYEPLP